jgi:hypothetical protein
MAPTHRDMTTYDQQTNIHYAGSLIGTSEHLAA